ncbi:MAG: helix-turn-helix domain-containing protein [Candidatus Aenigmarchaeota archaeon]|nr:helix-turn-helix domain-containing protein [Candidatus Aenigmarchaeota archaeon]
MLLQKIEGMLEESGFDYCEFSGCFDIAARSAKAKRQSFILLKLLGNVDSFQEEQANNLKILSRGLEAQPVLVGLHTSRETLSDNVIYGRFDIPTVTPKTLECILSGQLPELYRFRGGMFAEVDPKALRAARENADLSQSQLAEKVGVTKKSIYEHENRKMKIERKNAIKIERVLKTKVTIPLEIRITYEISAGPRSRFENKISKSFRSLGFSTDFVYQSPFNMLASEKKFMLLSDVEERGKDIRKKVPYISDFSRLSGKSAIIVTNDEENFDIPTIRERDLLEMKRRDLKRLVRKW